MTASSADTAEIPVAGRTAFARASREARSARPVIDEATTGPRIEPQFLPPLGGRRPAGAAPSAFAPGLDVAPGAGPSAAGADEPRSEPAAPVHPSAQAAPPAKRACRAELQAQRIQARRLRRRYALLGLSLLAGTLGATVAVLDTLH